MKRVERKEKLNAIDTKRFLLLAPGPDASEEDWKAALDNAHAQLEHQRIRYVYVSISLRVGCYRFLWLKHTPSLRRGSLASMTRHGISGLTGAESEHPHHAPLKWPMAFCACLSSATLF